MSLFGRPATRLATALALVTATTACGAMHVDEFHRQIRIRGGGLTTALVRDAMDALAVEYRSKDLSLTALTLKSPDASLTARVRDPRHPDRLDEFTYTEEGLGDRSPVKVSAHDDLDRMAFPIKDVTALGNVEKLVDTALVRTDGHVDSVEVSRAGAAPEISVAVSSPRTDAVVTFKADGQFLKVTRK
ncbi:hypothetical protein [Actinomadura formosensis]|uniref:hypothetical protein n=1 Tax=Actinomadura formosensis TaxID=60706 RepID=UPI003D8ED326